MAKRKNSRLGHKIRIGQMPELEIVHKDLMITVSSLSSGKLGDLTISRGGLGWFPSGPSKERHFTWEQFARCVREWKE
ncbi:MAG TPA: hypothetical protein VGY55_17365 [Pirellulales bacterium]|jgi:hypothetical protein|nr:hypothetical protein [Pirellulales bacterium]